MPVPLFLVAIAFLAAIEPPVLDVVPPVADNDDEPKAGTYT